MEDLGDADDFYSPLSPRILIFDALLADLENTTTHISKHPSLLPEAGGPRPKDSATLCSPILHSNGHRVDINPQQPPPPAYTAQQTVRAAQASTQPHQGDKDHLYSTVCKPKTREGPGTNTSTMVGSGLSELDQLLQELNRTQSSITDEILAQFPPGISTETSSLSPEPLKEAGPSGHIGKQLPTGSESKAVMGNEQPVITHTVPLPEPKTSATSATLELDRLMASLSDFKIHSTPPAQPAAQTRVSAVSGDPVTARQTDSVEGNLDDMLGKLQSNLLQQGVSTVPKGSCTACRKPIVGQMVTALGQTWHPEHFVCTHCQMEIGGRNFFEKEGLPYCEQDYWDLFSPRCADCKQPIMDKMVTALDRNWHPEHFCCVKCGCSFGPEGFHEREGKAYCRQDFYEMFASRCHGCGKAITDNYISALNLLWHPECFVCRDCYTPFVDGSFFEHAGQPYCETHYHQRRGSLCLACQKPIAGRCISAMGGRFHPDHFVCAFCLRHLNKGTFKEQNGKPYCHPCFAKLFG
ncbi:transforming growth factor beta-1-induced transcript 1 protein-like isoform X2 [Mobula birostris]|uniref:transforming growth factor beta-1-induced transcript 1 protein-like isoform X2 n=1 Tax=Mobula birostris TaxID=1983395 RepID=UPI003B28B80F